MSNMCLIVTPAIQELSDKIQQAYPDASQRSGFSSQMCAEWVGLYNSINLKSPDYIPAMKTLVNFIEKLRNQEGKSFLFSNNNSIFAENLNNYGKENAEGLSLQRVDLAKSPEIERELREAASIFERGKDSSGQSDERNSRETKEQKQKRLEAWAKENNLWVDNLSDVLEDNFGTPIEGGGEAVVYDAGKDVVKSISLDYYDGDPQLALDRILLHNYLFQDTQLTDIGFGRDSDGTFKIIVSQPYIKGRAATRDEIIEYARNRGFYTTDNNSYYFRNIRINDLNELNVIIGNDNIPRVIDAELRFDNSAPTILYEEIPVQLMGEIANSVALREMYDSKESSDPDLDKKFGNKSEISVSDMLDNLLSFNTPFKGFVEALRENIGEIGNIKIRLVPNSNSKVFGLAGAYSVLDNVIYINKNATFKGRNNTVDNTVLHEIIHAIVANSLNTPKHREELGKLFDEAKEKILKKYGVESFDDLPEYLKKGRLYGLQNLDEFAAELFTNNEFILELNDENTFGKKSDKKSLFSRLIEWIKSLLPKGVTDTYKRSSEIIEDILLNSGGTIQANRNLLAGSSSAANTQNFPGPETKINDDNFTESIGGYQQRTKENADWSDITLALAVDFSTYGEIATKKAAGDKYVSSIINPKVNLENLAEGTAANIFDQLDSKGTTKNLKLNIAGNGIYTLANNYTQEQVNELVYKVLRKLLFNGITISEIRSGGQTGVDEAGIIAAQRLGIKWSVHAPKGWRFRDINNVDVWGKSSFVDRFNNKGNNTIDTEIQEVGRETATGTINNENNSLNNKIEYGNEFRRIQETVRKGSKGKSVIGRDVSQDTRQGLAGIIGSQLRSFNGSLWGSARNAVSSKGVQYNIHSDVNPKLFHDVFEIVRYYTPNGELVDLHDDYSNCKCYLNDDGTCGFAIEPDGNLISVFNLGLNRGFLSAIKDMAISEGANHLDAFASSQQNLRLMYEYALGAKVASSMDYNMEYDHDDIARNHGNPQVVFMVLGKASEGEVKEKHFNKDQYDEAEAYQHSFLPQSNVSQDSNAKLSVQKAIKKYKGYWTRQEALNNPRVLYVFTDNTDRDSGSGLIPDDSWYSGKYGKGHHYPTMTAAVVRGLDNARPISTQRWYHQGAKGNTGRWTDADVDEFRKVIEEELKDIVSEFMTGKYDTIMFPDGDGLFNTSISNITEARTPVLYKTLSDLLQEYGFGSLVPPSQASVSNVDPRFKQGVETLSAYYEGGGALITDDFPGITDTLDKKLNDHFMNGAALSDADYYELDKYVRVVASPSSESGSAYIAVAKRQPVKKQSVDSLETPATGSSLGSTMVRFGETPTAEQQAAAQQIINNASSSQPEAPKAERPVSASYESSLNINDNPLAKFKRTFSPQQIKDRGAMISEIFSRIIDDALWKEIDSQKEIISSDTATDEEKSQASVRLNAISDPVKGRQLIVQEMGIPVIIDEIKEELERDLRFAREYGADDIKVQLWQNTIDFFEELFNTQATLDIEEREGIRIVDLKIKESTASEEDNDNLDDGDDEVGHVVSGSDGWSYQVRYTDPFASLSRKVRSMLYEIERPSSETDDLGNTRHYSQGQIYASFLSYLAKNMQSPDSFMRIYKSADDYKDDRYLEYREFGRGMVGNINDLTQDDMDEWFPEGIPVFPVLEEMARIYPWVEQVIDRLTDDFVNKEKNQHTRYPSTYGSMASQFYTNFRKAFIPYGKIQVGNNSFGVTPLNYEMEERIQYDKLSANYNNRMVLSEHSIYNSDGKINRENARWLKRELNVAFRNAEKYDLANMPSMLEQHSQHPEYEVLTEEQINGYNDYIERVRMLLQSFGIDATLDSVTAYSVMDEGHALQSILSSLEYIADTISKVEDSRVDDFNYILDTRDRYGTNMWSHFFDNRGLITDASYMQSFYDSASKKTKYSYSADNYIMKTFRGVCMGTMEERRAFIDSHFGKYEWFRNQSTGEWRNKWLEFWYNNKDSQNNLPYRNIDNITEAADEEGESEVRQYRRWTPDDIWMVQQRSYDPDSNRDTAYYLAPIFSDSPMSMTVLGPKMSMKELLYGYKDSANVYHQGALVSLVNQELYRIKYVQQRADAINGGRLKPIANFDDGVGSLFCFIPELNYYMCPAIEGINYPEEKFIDRMVRMRRDNASASEIEAMQIQAIKDCIDEKAKSYMVENSIHYKNNPLDIEQYYNMVYANAAIIQLTTVDLAFYGKGQRKTDNDTIYQMTVDFQKRFKEVYAGGIQLNTSSRYGKKTENVVLIKDDIITSPSYDRIAAIIDNSERLTDEDKKYIKSTFTGINVADAQAIRSMDSFRSVLDMMGQWTDAMEQALNNFKDNTWSRADFDVLYQTIKPFVYAVIERNDGNGGSILVPQQNKNSEICALMMYDLISNSLGNSPVYKALSRFMENTRDSSGNPLISMMQFESAGKVGNQGVVNISFNPDKVVSFLDSEVTAAGKDLVFTTYWDSERGQFLPNDIENAEMNYQEIKKRADFYLEEGEMSQDEYNTLIQYLRPTEDEIISMLEKAVLITNSDGSKSINTEVVHTIPFDNYYQQQPTPEHHIDAKATFGSQARNISVADLPKDFKLTVKGKGGKHTFKGRDAVIDFYYELLNENLLEDFFGKGRNGGLKGVFKDKKSLRDAVTEIVSGNPKYGSDFVDALQIGADGNFVLSPNSPTIFNLMQEIITSFFKNRITKQTINGAALIQAAGIGLDNDLRVVFNEEGKLLGAQCYMPLTTRKFFEPLLETKIIDGEEVRVLTPEKLQKAGLDKAIGYRIPTENKSSMMPLIIKGFTPLQNGSVIVLPAEITNIAGSDFDVDKMFIMLLSFTIQTHDMKKARRIWAQKNNVLKEISRIFYNSEMLDELSEEDPEEFKRWFDEHKDEFELDEPVIHKVEYDFSKTPKQNGRKARNNMIIQMLYNILISKEGSEALFNPQGFRDVERASNVVRILTDRNLLEQLQKEHDNAMPSVLPPVDVIVERFLSAVQERYPERYSHFKDAVNNMTVEQIYQAYIMAVTSGNNGNVIEYLMSAPSKELEKFINEHSAPESPLYPQAFAHGHSRNMAGVNQIGIYAIQGSMCAKYQRASEKLKQEQQFDINDSAVSDVDVSDNGRRLKNVMQMVGASADNGKNPKLSDMGSTMKTAPIIGYMLRAGMSHLDAALLINQPYMSESKYSYRTRYWDGILGKHRLASYPKVTTELLMKSLISPFEITVDEEKAIAGVCYRILMQHEAQEHLTKISRADSPNGAMQNSYAKARIQRYKVDLFNAKMGQDSFPFLRINDAISNDAIDTEASEDVVREQLKEQSMAFLHGMYALGINSFNGLVSPYFFGAQEWFDNDIVKPILYNLDERLSDTKKERIVDNIYKSYITYMLSGSSLFGNEENASMKQKRDYYLNTFPSDYQKLISENKEIRDMLSSILQVIQIGSRKRIVLQDVGSLAKGQKQDIQRRIEGLLYMKDPDTAKAGIKLATDLLIYSYFDNGLQFTHDSFSTMFTTLFLTNYPAYTDTLKELDRRITPEEEKNFIHQFFATYPDAAYKVDNFIEKDNVSDNIIRIDLNNYKMRKAMINEVMSPNPRMDGINVYPYIRYKGDVYELDREKFEAFPNMPTYHRLDSYQTYPRLPLFNREMSLSEMADTFPVDSNGSTGEEYPDAGLNDIPMSHNTGYGDPNIEPDSMFDGFDGMDDYIPDYYDDAVGTGSSNPDSFQSEGESELQKPFCNTGA